jgi:hypothetical protein
MKEIRWVGQVALMGQDINAYKMLIGCLDGVPLLGRLGLRRA